MLDEERHVNHPVMLTEFGGIAFSPDTAHTWGYTRATEPAAFAEQYTNLLRVVRSLPLFAGFCYTQFADTYQEANGLLYADRSPKFPLEEIARATAGPRTPREHEIELAWRERMMSLQRQQDPAVPDGHRMHDDR